MTPPIVMYGRLNYEDTERVRNYLNPHQIPFREVDINHDSPAEQFAIYINCGKRLTPALVIGDGNDKTIVTEPSEAEIDQMLIPAGYRL